MSKSLLAIDLECADINLLDKGPGTIRKDGSILTVCTYDGHVSRSYDIGKADSRWDELRDMLADESIDKVAHNGMYDYDWLQNGAGYRIGGKLFDTLTRAAILYEHHDHYDLDSCCKREGVEGKNYADTIDTAWAAMGGQGKAVQNLLYLPAATRIKYCEQDTRACWELYKKQQPKIEAERLTEVDITEEKVMHVLLEMRKNGFRVDGPKIARLQEEYAAKEKEALEALRNKWGITSITKRKGEGTVLWAFEQLGLDEQLLHSEGGAKSVSAQSIAMIDHDIVDDVSRVTRIHTMRTKYLEAALVDFTVNGRIHGSYHPTKRDEGGTVTGRLSCASPNMQNFSAKASKGGDLVRDCFLPEDGCLLGAYDLKQEEYRLQAHFAVGPGSQAVRDAINRNVDFHQYVQDMLGWHGPDARGITKSFSFGASYLMGIKTFKTLFFSQCRAAAKEQGVPTEKYIEQKYNEYFRKMTWMRPSQAKVIAEVERDGGIRTLGGRYLHLKDRSRAYVLYNGLMQGSCADILKLGLAEGWDAGVFGVLKLHASVHDENVFSIPQTKEGAEAAKEFARCMTKKAVEDIEAISNVKLTVPIDVDEDAGPTWYQADPGHNGGIHYMDELYRRYNVL